MIELRVSLPLESFELSADCVLRDTVTAVLGPSGSGKTSLLESIAGLRKHASGRITIDGDVMLDSDRHVDVRPERRRVGYVPQDAAVFPHLNVRKNILFAGSDTALFERLCDLLELAQLLNRFPATLSGGEKQRVALARALMTSPRLLLLDEPLASIDQPLREKVLVYLRRVRDTLGTPMIYVTHQAHEALALSTDCVVLDRGRITAHGTTDDVLHAEGQSGSTDNIFEVDHPEHDRARGVTRARTAEGLTLVLPWDQVAEASFPLAVRISTEDVMLFLARPEGISSRNVFNGVVRSVTTRGGISDVTIAIPSLVRVRITRDAAEDLRLVEGLDVWLALRSRAFRIVG